MTFHLRPHSRLAAALAVPALLLTGCANDDDATIDASQSPSPTAVAPEPTATGPTGSPTDTREWATCESTRAGLQVSYPADWTARDRPDGGCAYFDPQPFDVEPGTEAPAVAIRLDVESVAYDRVLSGYLDGEVSGYLDGEVISQRETTVAGYDAIRVEDRDTGGPMAAKGHRVTYVADLGDQQTLVLTTNETDAGNFEQAQGVLDEMAERLERID